MPDGFAFGMPARHPSNHIPVVGAPAPVPGTALVAPMFISERHRRVVVPLIPQLESLSPDARRFDWQGAPHLAVPHDAEHVRLLRNFGIAAPAPILHYYDWSGTTPFEAQPLRRCVTGGGGSRWR